MSKGNALLDNDGMLSGSLTPHAGCWVSTPGTTTITVAGTYYVLDGASASTALDLVLFTNTSPGRLTYIGTITKPFKVDVKGSITSNTNNLVVSIRIAKNGTPDVSSTQSSKKATSTDIVPFAAFTTISFATGDYVEVYITDDSAGSTITVSDCVIEITTI